MRDPGHRFPNLMVALLSATALLVALACQKAAPPPASTGSTAEKAPRKARAQDRFTIDLTEKPAFPLERHLESKDIASGAVPFAKVFEAGDKLFHTPYNGLDGVGMNKTPGGASLVRFSVGPIAGSPVPIGVQACGSCHNKPFGAGGGLAHTRVFFDPDQNGVAPFNARATISLFGNGVVQRVAEEMTEKLFAARDAAANEAKAKPGTPVRQALLVNGVDFGAVTATGDAGGNVKYDVSEVRGVSPDLVIRPFGWKGTITSLRNFSVAAASFGMGMQAEEFVWRLPPAVGTDPDADGVSRELSVGDITAMTISNAAQEAPTELARVAALGVVPAPDAAGKGMVDRGRTLFGQVGCASCHVPEMRLADTVFEEPTKRGAGQYVDAFLAGKDPDYDPTRPVRFDLLKDSQEPRIEAHPEGGAVVRLYGDLKRHDMGRRLADPAPVGVLTVSLAPLQFEGKPAGVPASEFLTPELWGVGNTGPWLHDDRAGTLAEAITLHGEDSPPKAGQPGRSEAQEARDAYLKLSPDDQRALVAFLKSLVNYSSEE
jgi:mono/diheme cytochrome c family protein